MFPSNPGITLLFILSELVVPVAVTVLYPSLLKLGLVQPLMGACLRKDGYLWDLGGRSSLWLWSGDSGRDRLA